MNRALVGAVLALLAAAAPLAAQSDFNKRTLVAAFQKEDIDWNPLTTYSAIEAQLYTAVYEGLMTFNPETLRPMPGMAESYELSADKKTYTFHLRAGARFGDGTPIEAATFRDSWLKMLDPAAKAPFAGLLDAVRGASDYRTGKSKNPSAVAIKAVDAKTLRVELSSPTAYFLQIVCHQALVPLYPKAGERDPRAPVVGNGPFKMTVRRDDRLEFAANPDYWDRQSVKIDTLVVLLTDDAAAMTKGFNDGEVQWADSGANFEKLADHGAIHFSPQFSTSFLYFSNDKPAFRNPQVRKALTMLMPLSAMRSKDLFLMPSSRLVPEIPDYPAPETIGGGDKAEALRLLEKAGYPRGKGLPPITLLFPKSEVWHQMAESIKKGWKDLEVKVSIKETEAGDLFDQLKPADFTISTISWIGDYADPMTFLDLWNSSSSLNKSAYANKEYDGLLSQSNAQQGKERYQTLSKAEELLLTTGQVIPINHSPSFNVIDLDSIGGWYDNALNVHPFKYLEYKLQKPPRSVARL